VVLIVHENVVHVTVGPAKPESSPLSSKQSEMAKREILSHKARTEANERLIVAETLALLLVRITAESPWS
jgi:hypothetical protein